MKKISLGIIIVALIASAFAIQRYNQHKQKQFVSDSQTMISDFSMQLKQELVKAISEKGIPGAIQTCKLRAPALAKELNADSPLTIKRTSLKIRNPANAPDEWERKILTEFEQQIAAGTSVDQLTATETVKKNGKKVHRHMRAIGVKGICLNCHGDKKNLSQKVINMLKNEYPDDQAVGYQLGQIRGAFSISQTFNN